MKRILIMLAAIFIMLPSFVFAEGEVPPVEPVEPVEEPDTIKPVITVSLAEGSYSAKQQVTLSSNEEAVIYYSLDGSIPDEVYSNPIMVDKTMTIKYYGKDLSDNSSSIVSVTYTMLDRDQDGLLDGEDQYPDDSTNTPLADRDQDGIPDGQDQYPDDPTNTPAYDETSQAEDNKKTQSILIMLLGVVLTGIVMGGKGLL